MPLQELIYTSVTTLPWRMAYEAMPAGLLDQLAENMAVFSLELNGAPLEGTASFGAKLNAMFMDGIAAE